ncbi:MAG: 2-isopropylmalate synthase, partial [Candidatus Moranbacteria bacterium]|nr:2-isopropylmalate synthase [Candidatus Moranbacteria bacterium]
SKGLNVIFAGEDSTRTEKKYLLKFIKSIEKYIFGFIICDTVGILTPSKTKKLVLEIKDKIDCKLGVHFHNDRGLADKNTLAAIESGAVIVSGTTGGIGERAGNADLCNIALNCKVGDIDLEKLTAIKSLVYKLGGSKPAKPLSRRAFWHESGIHVNALLKDPLSYNASLPEKNGRNNKFFFGKFSGISNYRYLFKDKYSEKQLIKMRDFFKELSYKNKKSYSAGEIRRILLEKGFDRMH